MKRAIFLILLLFAIVLLAIGTLGFVALRSVANLPTLTLEPIHKRKG
jgi:hypothetical protein